MWLYCLDMLGIWCRTKKKYPNQKIIFITPYPTVQFQIGVFKCDITFASQREKTQWGHQRLQLMHKLQFFPQQQKPKNFSKQQQSILSLFGRITNSLHLRDLHTHNVRKQISYPKRIFENRYILDSRCCHSLSRIQKTEAGQGFHKR